MNLKDLIKTAKDADVDVSKAPSYEDFKPQVGEQYTVKTEHVMGVTSKAGNPGVSFLLRIVNGPDGINRTIFENIYFADVHPNIIARNLHYAELLGVASDDLASFDFPAEPGGANGVDFPFTEAFATLEPGYRKDKGDPTKEWSNHHYTDSELSADGPTVTVEADTDGDLGWDD